MRILYLTNGFPFPLTSGYLRHYFLIRELCRKHRITLLSVVGSKFSPEHEAALAPFTERILTFSSAPRGRAPHWKALHRVRALAGYNPAVQQMRRALQQLVRTQHFDAVVVSGKQTFPAIADLEGLPVVTDMCDATSLRIHGRMRYAHWLRLPVLWLEYQQVRHVEQQLIEKSTHLLFATARDRAALLDSSCTHATVVPNGVDISFWARTSGTLGKNTIVFTGAMDYAPNTDAALFLIDAILPLVRASIPDVKLLIVGRDPPAKLRASADPSVDVTGYVDDVRPYLDRATVFAAPLRFGVGIQNKLLEALAMELPVVASPLAAEGLCTEDGEWPPLQVASDPASFAEALIGLLNAHAVDPAPNIAGRDFVQRNFVWSHSGAMLDHVLRPVGSRSSAVTTEVNANSNGSPHQAAIGRQ
jgi:glycosyltransferase involved in cell wall biosynthesis